MDDDGDLDQLDAGGVVLPTASACRSICAYGLRLPKTCALSLQLRGGSACDTVQYILGCVNNESAFLIQPPISSTPTTRHRERMPRLIRRRPLSERIKSALNPWDFFLWLSEEIETRDLGSKSLGTQVGLALNFVFLLARANGVYSTGSYDDVFSDVDGAGWFAYLVSARDHFSFDPPYHGVMLTLFF